MDAGPREPAGSGGVHGRGPCEPVSLGARRHWSLTVERVQRVPDAARDAGEDRRVAQSVGTRLARPQLVHEVEELTRLVTLERHHELLVVESEGIGGVDADLRVSPPDLD